jgi:multiple sugar transport system substrate-binding protein
MKHLFLIIGLLLLGASAALRLADSERRSDVPILYWVTDPNPARSEQVRLFQAWMKRNHPDHPCELRIDSANGDTTPAGAAAPDPSKKIIQAVTGVGDDIMDLGNGGQVRYLQAIGALRDVTADAQRLGFGPDATYASIVPELFVGSPGQQRQYAFPCNVVSYMYFVNRATFKKYGIELPPVRWDFQQFEALGKRLVAAANPDPRHRTVFLTDSVPTEVVRRSLGLTTFNETGTRCVLDRPENVEALKLGYRWTYVDHILPTAAEKLADAAFGYGGEVPQLFNNGNYAMMWNGRYLLIQLREFNKSRARHGQPPLDLTLVECPNGGFPNTMDFTRCAAVYAGGTHQDLSVYFLQFLASEDYNLQIVRDADALPPNPIYTHSPQYLDPPDHPEEAEINAAFAKSIQETALGYNYSPFVLYAVAGQIDLDTVDAYMNDQLSAEAAARQEADRINGEIQLTLQQNPSLRPLYEQLTARQKQIEDLRAARKKIPLDWLSDPFYRKYYLTMGWAQ